MPSVNLRSKPDLFAVVLRARIIGCHSNKPAAFRIGNLTCDEGSKVHFVVRNILSNTKPKVTSMQILTN